jgi:hypothetical protein
VIAAVLLLVICWLSPWVQPCSIRWKQRFAIGMRGVARPRHHRARRVDRCGCFGGARHAGGSGRAGPDHCGRGAGEAIPNARVVFSGGSPNLVSNDAREADFATALFESFAVSKERLTMERRSRNTQENAEFSKALAAPKSGERWLLVTSAYHMPRASACSERPDLMSRLIL